MNKEIRKAISDEIFRRHGYRFMEAKIKPVHIANALMRAEHECVGRMSVLKQLFQATLNQSAIEDRLTAAKGLVENHRERWGRLGEAEDLRSSALMTKVLPLRSTCCDEYLDCRSGSTQGFVAPSRGLGSDRP